MLRWAASVCCAVLLALHMPTGARAQNVEGLWKLDAVYNGSENTFAIVKLESQGGKTTGELVAATPRIAKITLKSVAQDGNALTVTLTNGNFNFAFEVIVPAGATKKLTGSFVEGSTIYPAILTLTEDQEIDAKGAVRPLDCPPAQEARSLTLRANTLRAQAKKAKDAEEKEALLEKAMEAAKVKAQALYREVLAKHADNPAVFEASLALVRAAKANDASADDVRSWAAAGVVAAKTYGPRYEAEFAWQVAAALLGQPAYAKLAVPYARQVEKTLTPKSSADDQVRALSLVVRALKANDRAAETKEYDLRLIKLESQLDEEYMAKMPPFKGTAFEGRQGKGDRAAFMELFTGATCPPCVAADLAFDVLQKSYKPSELVLIQYHVHIPGPDPMTNPDTLARWNYYRKAFPDKVGGVPSSIFDGKPQGGGGGGVAQAEGKYDAYRKIIDPLIDVDAGAKLAAQAVRNGDRVSIDVRVDGVKNPGAHLKLRILLAEETVRYAGSNKIRLHHNVVRAFPGGVDGQAVLEAAFQHNASIDLGDLRANLDKYLTHYEANERPFANPARPLDMANLRVIAFVQDDATQEILQAVQAVVDSK